MMAFLSGIDGMAWLVFICIVGICAAIVGIGERLAGRSFVFPYFDKSFDASGKRSPKIEDSIDLFLIHGGIDEIEAYMSELERWKVEASARADRGLFRRRKQKRFAAVMDERGCLRFSLYRTQTRYRQRNYVRVPYRVAVPCGRFTCGYDWIRDRQRRLAAINFECTLREYHAKDQRRLMTRELREKIMARDNYTCRICGKRMPDEVGLQIDHIVPVSKGGKTVASNLQVLCDRCNRRKSNRA